MDLGCNMILKGSGVRAFIAGQYLIQYPQHNPITDNRIMVTLQNIAKPFANFRQNNTLTNTKIASGIIHLTPTMRRLLAYSLSFSNLKMLLALLSPNHHICLGLVWVACVSRLWCLIKMNKSSAAKKLCGKSKNNKNWLKGQPKMCEKTTHCLGVHLKHLR